MSSPSEHGLLKISDIEIRGKAQFREMLWKNGRGTTVEMAISPSSAVFSEGRFLWRLSSAPIIAAGPFSKFPDYDRVLMVIEGKGLCWNGRAISSMEPLYFHGEEEASCTLEDGPVRDIGVIYRRGECDVKMEALHFSTNNRQLETHVPAFFYVAKGSFSVGPEVVLADSLVRFKKAGKLAIDSAGDLSLVKIEIRDKSSVNS